MNAIRSVLSNDWANALGWMLLHSVWQSLIISMIVIVLLRFIPTIFSKARYAVTCAGLLLLLLSSAFTFLYFIQGEAAFTPAQASVTTQVEFAFYPEKETPLVQKIFSQVRASVQTYMPIILTTWMVGFLFFAARLYTGVWHTCKLKAEALSLENEWSAYIRSTGRKLGIRRLVALAESPSINSPIVIGYLKPVILIPAGMLTGLTTEQLETIFVHELAHIKRHDYLINLIQSLLETVFFFNPFVWILSDLIRREREYCCDDMVMQQHGGARAYAYALTHLAEVKLSTQAFALSLAEDKNQLLNRIRRIMETSVKNNSGKTRILLPAILLTGGLLCISWLGVQQEKAPQDTLTADQDTIIKNGARYSRKSIITIDKNGQPQEEVVEEFEGDEALRPWMQEPLPSLPDISSFMPPPSMMPALPHLDKQGIPDSLPLPAFPFKDYKSWEEMSKAFEEHFKNFGEQYSFRTDPQKLMEEFEEKFGWQDWSTRLDSLRIPDHVFERFENFKGFEELEESLERLRGIEMDRFRDFDRSLEEHNKQLRSYEQVLREELIEDGYLSEKETIESLQWNDTMFQVNGKKIKDSDLKKYQEIHDKYFGAPGASGKPE